MIEGQPSIFQRLEQECNQAMKDLTELLAKGEERLKANTELLQKSTEDIHMLLAFIKSKGLQPPKIQSKFVN
ncbi:MAG: hypothetical protein WA653_20145 [Candidatus Sulfotelmatobacter sp.]